MSKNRQGGGAAIAKKCTGQKYDIEEQEGWRMWERRLLRPVQAASRRNVNERQARCQVRRQGRRLG